MTAVRLLVPILVIVMTVPLVPAQNDTGYREKIQVRVLNIEAVVSDRDGVRVPDLDRSRFRLLVDGEQVPIEYFSEIQGGSGIQSDNAVPGIDAGEPAGVNFLVFIDNMFAIKADRDVVLKALIERVKNLRAVDRGAVVSWDGELLDILVDWTSSKEQLVSAFETAIKGPSYGARRASERRQFGVDLSAQSRAETRLDAGDRWTLGTQERQYAELLSSQLYGVVGAASATMRGVPDPGGRKLMLVLSGGWPMDVGQYVARDPMRMVAERNVPRGVELYGPMADTANLLGYTLYTVDVPGDRSNVRARGGAASGSPATQAGSFIAFSQEGQVHSSLDFLAFQTGGLPFINSDRLAALDEGRQDVRNYYWLGFTPTWTENDEVHEIDVEIVDSDLIVRTRRNFFDLSPRTQIVMAATSSLFVSTEGLSGGMQVSLGAVEKVSKKISQAPLSFSVPLSAVTGVPDGDDNIIQLDVVIVSLDSSGGRTAMPVMPLAFTVPNTASPESTIGHEVNLQMKRKAVKIVVAVYDRNSDKTFAKTINVK